MKTRLLFTMAVAVSMSAFAQIPQAGLVAYYPFNGNAQDATSNNNDGITNGCTLVADRFGTLNAAYSFNGTSDYITSTAAPLTNTPFTISVWLKVAQTNNLNPIISLGETGSTSLKKMYFAATYGSTGKPSIGCGGASDITSTKNGVATNKWVHLVVTCSGWNTGGVTYYINDTAYTSNTSSGSNNPLPANNNPFTIGKHTGGSSAVYFDGVIDDLAIYNRVLSQSGIDSLYNDYGSTTQCVNYITVTDTLVVNAIITGFQPLSYASTLKIYPNPSMSDITIDYGNYMALSGYTLKIKNTLNQDVFSTAINHQTDVVSFSNWSGKGIYFVHLIDGSGHTIDIRKIVLQ